MTRITASILGCAALTALPCLLSAQTMVERAVLTSAAGTSATASKGVGKSAAGVFDSLNKTLGQTSKSESKAASGAPTGPGKKATAAQPPAHPVEPIDPLQIKAGLARTELIRRFGEPSLKSTRTEAGASMETFWYARAGQDDVVIRLKDGAVTSVSPPPAEAKNAQP